MDHLDPTDPHQLLGVPHDATDAEIRRAFRRLARTVHPDVGGDPERFVALRDALRILTGPTTPTPGGSPRGGAPVAEGAETPEGAPGHTDLSDQRARVRARWSALELSWQRRKCGFATLNDPGRRFVATTGAERDPGSDADPGPGSARSLCVGALTSGDTLWSAGFAAPVVPAPIALNDLLIVATHDGVVHGLAANNGLTQWERRLTLEPDRLVAGEGIAVVASAEALAALRPDGAVGWVVRPHGGVGEVVAAGDLVVVGTGAGAAVALDASSGRTRWWLRHSAPFGASPVAAGGSLWIASAGASPSHHSRITGVDPATGAARHTLDFPGAVVSLHAVGGLLVVRDVDGGLTAVRRGRPLWRAVVPSAPSAPCHLDGTVAVASADGVLRFLSGSHGTELHQVELTPVDGGPAHLVVVDDVVVVVGADGGAVGHRRVRPAGGPSPQ